MIKESKIFDSVSFFRNIKEKLATLMQNMTFEEKRIFMQNVIQGKIKIK